MDRVINHILDLFARNFFMPGREIFDLLFSLILAVIIGIVISQIYRQTHRGINFELSFMTTLVLLSPIVAVVMMFIRGDLVLSLGLIGSMSIIRFRTPIKDTRDMVFLFWAIAVGLGCGTYNWTVVIVSTIFITLIVFALYFVRYGRSNNSDFVMVVSGDSAYRDDSGGIERIIKRYTQEIRVRSHELETDQWELIFELRFPGLTEQTTRKLVEEIKSIEGVQKVSLLAPQLALPV